MVWASCRYVASDPEQRESIRWRSATFGKSPELFIFARSSSGMRSKGLEIGQENLDSKLESKLCRKGQRVNFVNQNVVVC